MEKHPKLYPNNKLRDERLRQHWTQQDLADHLGTTKLTVGRWERGISVPCAHFRLQLSTLFGKNAEELGLLPTFTKHDEEAVDQHNSVAQEPLPLSWCGISPMFASSSSQDVMLYLYIYVQPLVRKG